MTRESLVVMVVAAAVVAAGSNVSAEVALPIQCPMQAPDRIEVDRRSLVRLGAAVRSRLVGLIDVYRVAIYVAPEEPRVASLLSEALPKAIWLGVCYDDSVPSYVPPSWRRELVPAVGPLERQRLRMEFVPLRRGDIIMIQFAPNVGTSIVQPTRGRRGRRTRTDGYSWITGSAKCPCRRT